MKTMTTGATMKTKQMAKLIEVGKAVARTMGNERWEWQTTHTFLAVCVRGGDGVPMQEIEKALDMGQATVSRNVAKLGQGLNADEPGARLLEAYEDPFWRRRKLVRLTERGRKFADQISSILEA
jgi:DNA-binding MarR family transcriptional regulator